MIQFLKKFIIALCKIHPLMKIDSMHNIKNKKLSIVLTYNDSIMVSIEILPNGECDLLAVELNSEHLLLSKTMKIENNEELVNEIGFFLNTEVPNIVYKKE